MKILVVGLGGIGKRHVRLLKELGCEVWGADNDHATCEVVSREHGIGTHPAPEAILQAHRIDGVIVATPTHTHHDVAWRLMCKSRITPLLIEKPLAHESLAARAIVEVAQDWGHRLLVGYCLRFHPGLQRLKDLLYSGAIGKPLSARVWFGHYLPDWHPGQDYRKWYSCRKAEGGGVLQDASHELDYVAWLLGEPVSVSATLQNSGTLEIDAEDIADVNLTFASGAQAAVHLDYLRRRYSRGCEIVGTDGALTWDFGYSHPVTEVPVVGDLVWVKHDLVVGDLVWVKHDFATRKIEPDDMYRAELQHFLAVCRGEAEPLVTGADGVRAVRIVEAARESAETGRVVVLC